MADCFLMSYNAKQAESYGKPLTAVNRLVMTVSDPLTHSEFRFSARNNNASHSATMQDKPNGCRTKLIQYSHPERWVPLILPMTDGQEDRAYSKAFQLCGCPYDFVGVASLKTGLIKQDPDKYWCSECVGELIKAAYEWGDDFIPSTLTPNDLYFEVLHRLGKELA